MQGKDECERGRYERPKESWIRSVESTKELSESNRRGKR